MSKKILKLSARATGEQNLGFKDFDGNYLVLYFYPKDNTPGCTTEGCDFAKNYPQFKKLKTEVWGISKDSVATHEKFKKKMGFPFELISDEDGEWCKSFDVFKKKSMFGNSYMGIERSTFVINKKGEIVKEWRRVKVPNHVQEVLDFIKDL